MSWIKRKWAWAMRNKLFWLNLIFVGVIPLAVWVIPSPGTSDFRVKTLGMAFQLIGVYTVWLDLSATSRAFERVGILAATWEWLKVGFGASRPAMLSSNLVSKSTVTADLEVRYRIDAQMSDTERLKMLQKEIDSVWNELGQARQRQKADIEALNALIHLESQKGEDANRALSEQLEAVSAGNASMLLFGLAWLAVGIVLSTWAPEISKIAGGLWLDVQKTL